MLAIMSAMREELDAVLTELRDSSSYEAGQRIYHTGRLWNHDVVLVFSRWGKVAAATTTTHLITRHQPSRILFTGVAGTVMAGLGIGDVVVGTQLVQHDLDARPLFARYEVPLLGRTWLPADETLGRDLLSASQAFLSHDMPSAIPLAMQQRFGIATPQAIRGDIASGDKFFSSDDDIAELRHLLPAAACVEMEGAAVAQVCHEYRVPFGIVRTISDAAGDGAHTAFAEFVRSIAATYAHGILKRLLGSRRPNEYDFHPTENSRPA